MHTDAHGNAQYRIWSLTAAVGHAGGHSTPSTPIIVQMYMLLIILLMLSQDSAFAQNIHRITLQVHRAA